MGPISTYPVHDKTIKRIFFSVTTKNPTVKPIVLYAIDNQKGKEIPKDAVFAINLPDIEALDLMVDQGGFHYYWGHLTKKNTDKFVENMYELGIIVKREKK